MLGDDGHRSFALPDMRGFDPGFVVKFAINATVLDHDGYLDASGRSALSAAEALCRTWLQSNYFAICKVTLCMGRTRTRKSETAIRPINRAR